MSIKVLHVSQRQFLLGQVVFDVKLSMNYFQRTLGWKLQLPEFTNKSPLLVFQFQKGKIEFYLMNTFSIAFAPLENLNIQTMVEPGFIRFLCSYGVKLTPRIIDKFHRVVRILRYF